MRTIALIAAVLLLTGCDVSSEAAPPPIEAPIIAGPDYSGGFDAAGAGWRIAVRGSSVVLARPDLPDVATANPGVRVDGDQGVWDGMAGEARLVLRLTPVDCADGDRHLAYAAEVWIDGETLRGCAAKQS